MATLAEESLNTGLADALVRLAHECELDFDQSRAEQIVSEVQHAWPGDPAKCWRMWLVESCESLGLRARQIDLTIDKVIQLARDGAKLAGGPGVPTSLQVVVGGDRQGLYLAEGPFEASKYASRQELLQSAGERGDQPNQWVVVEHPRMKDVGGEHELDERPIERLVRIIRPEWSDIWMILVFALFAGVLALATPIAVEALVNTVAFGRLLQPVVVLSIMLFGFLAFAALMRALQAYVAEVIQQRLFVRVAADLAHRLPRVESSALASRYGPELANRFLDVVTLQKGVAILLLDGVSVVLATLVGMAVLAFYHPWLLGFDLFLLVVIVGGLWVLGRGAIGTGIDESKLKYKLTSWFEDVVRCPSGFKMDGGSAYAIDRANQLTAQYLRLRRSHFRILFRQITFTLGLQAVAGTVLLGVGGWLVIDGQLSLGQLVAAELIVTTILASMAKLGKHLETYYDLVAAVDKLGYLFDLPVEESDGVVDNLKTGRGLAVELIDLRLKSGHWVSPQPVSARIEPGERFAIVGAAASGKTALARLIYGLEEPGAGRLEINNCEPRDLRPDVLRSAVAVVGDVEIIEGSVADNVRMGRPMVTTSHIRRALDQVGLLAQVMRLPQGINNPLLPHGVPLSASQQRLLMIARAIAAEPELLVIDGLLDSLPDEQVDSVIDALSASRHPWTLIVTTGRQSIGSRFKRVLRLHPTELAA